MENMPQQRINRYLLFAALSVIAVGTVFYHYVERWSWLDSYYFCVVTLATVGYGDFVPTTPAGKLFTTFYIFVGVGIITTFITYSLRRRAEARAARHAERKASKQ
jgi:voltage-gated potassium channel